MKKEEKTNVMRFLDGKKIEYTSHFYEPDAALTGEEIGCSPIGMKKHFQTFIHETAAGFDKVFVSAGKVGAQVELSPGDLIRAAACTVADIAA